MTEQEIFEKIIEALLAQNYRVDPESLASGDIDNDTEPLAKRIRLGIDAINFISKIFDIDFKPELKSVFRNEKFKEDIKKIYPITNYVLFKYVLAQPIIIALIKADNLSSNDYKTIANQYDSLMLSFREHTGKLLGTKLSVTGLMIFVFSDSNKALEFETKYQSDNKMFHFWKKTWTIPWGIDTSKKKIIKHKGLPILVGSLIDAKKMEFDMFNI